MADIDSILYSIKEQIREIEVYDKRCDVTVSVKDARKLLKVIEGAKSISEVNHENIDWREGRMKQEKVDIKTFNLSDLVGRKVGIQSFRDKNYELIIAKDLKTGELFVLKEIMHPLGPKADYSLKAIPTSKAHVSGEPAK